MKSQLQKLTSNNDASGQMQHFKYTFGLFFFKVSILFVLQFSFFTSTFPLRIHFLFVA